MPKMTIDRTPGFKIYIADLSLKTNQNIELTSEEDTVRK